MGRNSKSFSWKKSAIGAGLVCAGCIFLFIGIKGQIGPNIDAVSRLRAEGMVAQIINETIKEELSDSAYDDALFLVKRGKDGNIQMVQANAPLVNRLVSGFTTSLQQKYDEMEPRTVKVSYGTILGSRILSQVGLYVHVRVQPLSVSNWDFATEFETQGINQTKYKIYIVAESNVRVLQPFSASNLKVKNKILISEAVIVGNVPESYVNVPKEDILDAIN